MDAYKISYLYLKIIVLKTEFNSIHLKRSDTVTPRYNKGRHGDLSEIHVTGVMFNLKNIQSIFRFSHYQVFQM